MSHRQLLGDPFALIVNPKGVLRAIERSQKLCLLKRHVCRPLDKPLIPHVSPETAAFDEEVERRSRAGGGESDQRQGTESLRWDGLPAD